MVQLASGSTFRTDQVASWLAELGLGPDAYPLLEAHVTFLKPPSDVKSLLSGWSRATVHWHCGKKCWRYVWAVSRA